VKYGELSREARDAITERFPGLSGPLGAAVLWKAAGGGTDGSAVTLTGFEAGRLIATLRVPASQ
jgi:hypothetical protein